MYAYKQFGNKFVLSIQNRTEITEAVNAFVKEQNINTGSVYGIGMDGKPYLHLHITLGRSDYTALTGHLLTANIHGACELMIEKLDGDVSRKYDDETGLNLYDL